MQWLEHAACRGHDPELFFPVSETGPSREQADRAKAVCRTCPVVFDCLQWAIDAAIRDGVWGGLTAQQRRHLTRNRRSQAAEALRKPDRVRPEYAFAWARR